MIVNDPYIAAPGGPAGRLDLLARLVNRLHLDGEWDGALALLDGADSDGKEGGTAAMWSSILVERLLVAASSSPLAEWLRRGFSRSGPARRLCRSVGLHPHSVRARPAARQRAGDAGGLRRRLSDETWRGWATFWQGAVADNVQDDPGTARQRYGEALALCRDGNDLLLESYVARHQGGHLIKSDRAGL